MWWNDFRPDLVEPGRRFRIARHRPFYLVSKRAARPVRREFPEAGKFHIKSRREAASITSGGRHLQPCPWNSRAEFLKAQNTSEMNQLRRFLADTIDLQAEFLVARLDASLPKMLAEAAPADRTNVQKQFERLTKTPQGCYALI